MGLVWNPYAAQWVLVGGLEIAVAAGVLLVAAGRIENRALALLLFVEGVTFVAPGFGWMSTEFSSTRAWSAVGMVTNLASLPLYVAVLATLGAPLSRRLGGRRLVPYAFGASAVLPLAWFAWPEQFILEFRPGEIAPLEGALGPGMDLVMLGWILTSAFGVAVAVSALRASRPGTLQRRQALAFLAAFGARDVGIIASMGLSVSRGAFGPVELVVLTVSVLLFVPLLAYGILRAQLFDMDLKIRWTLRRGTVAGAFVATFFVVSEVAQEFLNDAYGWALGGAAAGLLIFAVAPLQRAAERVSDRVMPGVRDTPDYVSYQKFAVYRAALEGAFEDGGVTEKERAMLARLQRKLGIADDDAARVEREISSGIPG